MPGIIVDMHCSSIVEAGLNEAGTIVAVIADPERGDAATIEYANEPFSSLMRRPVEELRGATLALLLDTLTHAGAREELLQALGLRKPAQLDLALTVGGVASWLGLRLSFPPRDASGKANAILIGRDITRARKDALQEDKLRQLLAKIFMRINTPVTIVGRGGGLMMSNAAFRQLTGFSADELKMLRVQDLTPPEYVDAMTRTRDTQFRDGRPYDIDFETLVKGGGRVAVRMTSELLSDSDESYRVVTLNRIAESSDRSDTAARPMRPVAPELIASRDQGELRAVSLEALRDLFGAAWERIALRAMMRAEQIIRKRLKRADILSRLDHSRFMIWFDSSDHDTNEAALEAIVRDVRLAFLSEFGEEMARNVESTLVPATAVPTPPASGAPGRARLGQSWLDPKPAPRA